MIAPRTERGVSRRTLLVGGAGFAAALGLSGCTGDRPSLRIACGERGGTYVEFGRLLAEALLDRGVAAAADVVITQGSVANLELLRAGEADLAMSLVDAAAADTGNLVALGRVYQNYLQCLVPADGSITKFHDLAGRTLSVGAPASGTARTARLVLAALAIDDLEQVQLPLDEAVTALDERRVDAIIWSGGIPVPEALRIGHHRLRLVNLTAALTPLEKTHPGLYHRTLVPPGVYASQVATPAIGIANLLLCRPTLPAEVARGVVDILVEDADNLVPEASAGLQYLIPSNLIDTAPITLHPAAAKQFSALYR